MRVSVVEDEPGIANFVRQGLTEAGYAIDLVGDGRTALDCALAADYDAYVLDILLPGMNGLDLLRDLPCETLTGYHPPDALDATQIDGYKDASRGVVGGVVEGR